MSVHKTDDSGKTVGVGLLSKAFQILDMFTYDHPAWTQADLAKETGVPKSTVSRVVRYLCARGYLMLFKDTGRYSLGPAAMDLGHRAFALMDLREVAMPILQQLARETSETVILTLLNEAANQVICTEQISSNRGGLRVFERVGSSFPLHAGAAPKAVLAYLPEMDKQQILGRSLNKFAEHTITDPKKLIKDLQATLQRGYSVSHEETYTGVHGVAAAFFGPGQKVMGSVAVATPEQRATEKDVLRYGTLVRRAADQLSEALGGETPVIAYGNSAAVVKA